MKALTNRQFQKTQVEFVYWIAPDGTQYPLFSGARTLLAWDNVGMPDINLIRDKGPFQNGSTVRDIRYNERSITIELYERGRCREDWYCNEANLIDALRHNRANGIKPGRLLFVLPDNTEREIEAYLQEGPKGNWNGRGPQLYSDLSESITFFCDKTPFFRNPEPITFYAGVAVNDSCFPFCLPFCLGEGVIDETFNIYYCGTWNGDQATIIITGPVDAPTITNQTTGQQIKFNYSVAAGETITISLDPDIATVTNNFGDNLIGAVENVSDLTTFFLTTKGELSPSGLNVLNLSGANGVAGQSSITFTYYVRHISLFAPCLPCGEENNMNPLIFVAIVSQAGTADPFYNQVLRNDFNEVFSLNRVDSGEYEVKSVLGAFTSGKTLQYLRKGVVPGLSIERDDNFTLTFFTYDNTGTKADDKLTEFELRIEVYR